MLTALGNASPSLLGGIMNSARRICWACWCLSVLVVGGCNAEEAGSIAVQVEPEPPPVAKEEPKPQPPRKPVIKKGPHTNRLARETSPYLLMHAHNPVDWYPWGPEAFERAKQEDKPIFLSIGYSSCYWCHVMERKVFTNAKIAAYMNEHFVNIKVDREERPDIDDIYMTALSIYFQMSGSSQGGGWPLSMFMTPEGKPIAGGTYIPPKDEGGRVGFTTVMTRIHDLWTDERKSIEGNAEVLTAQVRRVMKPRLSLQPAKIERQTVADVSKAIQDTYDSKYGGVDFNSDRPDAPKFPVPTKLAFLQYEIRQQNDDEAGKILYHTLDSIANGGIQDHLAGGFHRYSTDRAWLVPHFEKMLYDNAQLADVYVEAFRQTKKPLYRDVALSVFDYILSDMTDENGAFYSALDAETDTIEGKYYVWSPEEVTRILGEEDAKLFKRVYGMNREEFFEHGYVLHRPDSLEMCAKDLNLEMFELNRRLEFVRKKMLAARKKRKSPMRDDKILTSWNGLMIRALANGGAVFGRQEYIVAAEKAAMFILTEMRDDQGRLLRTYRAKTAKLNAYLDDYAFLTNGLLALYRATSDEKWLNAARRLTDEQIELFWDEKGDGFFFTSHHHEELLARTKNAYDSVLPSGNSVSVRNLIQIAALTNKAKYRQFAKKTLKLFAPRFKDTPRGMSNMALAMGEFLDAPEINEGDAETESGTSNDSSNLLPKFGGVLPVSGESETAPTAKKQPKPELVAAQAFLEFDKLPAGDTCRVILLLNVKPGWHINANPAQPKYLKPTTFTIKTKQGTKLTNVRYPKGRKLRVAGFQQPLMVYEGRVAIYGELEVSSVTSGNVEEFELSVRYQACTDTKCESPKTVKLSGSVKIAGLGERVTAINERLFNPPKKTE